MFLRNIKFILLVFMLAGLSACAVNRSVVSLDGPENISNPANGVEIKLVSETDERVFEFKPATPDIPSLSEDEIINADIKARAFARKRNSYGQALGDVILPEGTTISGLMKETLTRAFRDAGFRVLEPGDPSYEGALAVDARVIQFWSWIEWGFWELGLRNRAEVHIKAPTANLTGGMTVLNESVGKHAAIFESDWEQSAASGLEELAVKVSAELRKLQ